MPQDHKIKRTGNYYIAVCKKFPERLMELSEEFEITCAIGVFELMLG
jgi:hypothetical protein